MYPGEGTIRIDATDYAHTIVRVTMKNGEKYALDISGAQYGWREPVMPWELYTSRRTRAIKEVVPFGGTGVSNKERISGMSEQRKWIQTIKENFAQNGDAAIAWWQSANCSSIDLLRLPGQEFLSKQAKLLDAVELFLQRYKAFQESHGGFEVKGETVYGGYDREFTHARRGNMLELLVKDHLTIDSGL